MIFLLVFEIWVYIKSFHYLLYIKVFKYCEKLSWRHNYLWCQKKQKKKTRTEFWRYGKSAPYKFFFCKFTTKCTEPIFDLVKIEAVCLFYTNLIICDFWAFLLKTDVLVHNFWAVYTKVKMVAIYGIVFPFIWDPTWLNFFQKFVFTIYRKECKLWPQWRVNLVYFWIFDLEK